MSDAVQYAAEFAETLDLERAILGRLRAAGVAAEQYDKSKAFGPEFFQMQKTWHCGIIWSIIEIVLCVVVAILITKHRQQDTEDFKNKYGPRFDKKIKQ